VGDAAQTAFSAAVRYEPLKNMYLRIQGQFFDRYYSDFDPFTLKGINARRESWKMPSYYLINLFAGYKVEFKKTALLLNGSITNLLNSVYIADARNNKNNNQDFDAKSATVMFGQGFRFNVSIGLQF
jgi:hypothetical protein